MRSLNRSAGALFALMASTAIVSPAKAQIAASPPPRFSNVDENGVDLTTGLVSFSLTEGSVGSGPGAISYERIWAQEALWVDNFTGGLYNATINGQAVTVVQLGGIVDTFTQSGGVYTSQKGNGATLVFNGSYASYTGPDGTSIGFYNPELGGLTSSCPGAAPESCMTPHIIAKPNGVWFTIGMETVTMCRRYYPNEGCIEEWTYGRPSGITSNAGFSASFIYSSNDPGGGSGPVYAWYERTGVAYHNSVTPVTPPRTSTFNRISASEWDLTDMGGRTWRLTQANGRITGIRRPGAVSDTTTYTYNAGGTVISATKDGVTTSYSRVVNGSTATMTVTNALGQQTVVTSDLTKGRPTSVQFAGRTTSYQYDTNSRLTRTTAPEGNYTQLTYDARGNVTQTRHVAKSGSGLADIVTSASFDATCTNAVKCNQPNSTTDARGNVTDYVYDATHGGVTSITAPAPTGGGVRPQTRITYSGVTGPSGHVAQLPTTISACQTTASCSGAADEVKVVTAYNNQFQPTSRTAGNGTGSLAATETYTYDSIGNLSTVDGPLSGTADTTKYRYDNARLLLGVVGPDPDGGSSLKHRAVRATYANGLQTKVENGTVNSQSDADWAAFAPAEVVDIAYDANARVKSQKLSNGATAYALTHVGYDAIGRIECSATRMNPAAYGSLPGSACSLGTEGSHGPDRIAKLVYDSAGQVSQKKIAVGTADEAIDQTLTYTNNGQLATVKDAENNLTNYEYDGHDRLSKTRYPNPTKGAGTSSTTNYEQLTYDAGSNVTNLRLRDGQSIAFTYDNLGRPTLKNLPGSEPDVTYAYDNLGRLTSASQTGHSLSFTYDALGRQLTETGPLGTVSNQWNLAGQRTQLSAPSGYVINYQRLVTGEISAMLEGGGATLAAFTYNDHGRRVSLSRIYGTSTSYAYDPVSRLSSLTHDFAVTANDVSWTYSYNPANQITGQTRSNDSYAWMGSVAVNRPYASNGLNQLTLSSPFVPTYDDRGNLTSAGSTTYAYSSENMLISATGGTSATLGYDPLGRLYQVGNGSTVRRFQYAVGESGLYEAIAEFDGAGLVAHHGFGPGVDEPMFWWDISGGQMRPLHADERGSIVALSDYAGNPVAKNSYDEYGIPGSSNVGRFQYTGQAWLPELGMYHYKARIYSPTLGRFLQTDPIGYGDGMNMYAYVGNDPVNFTDPLGLEGDGGIGTVTACGGSWMNCPEFWLDLDRQRDGPGGGSRDPNERADGTIEPSPKEEKPKKCKAAATSYVGSARDVLETTATGADIATIGLAAGGVTGPLAIATKGVGIAAELGLGVVNAYDGFANNNWGSLQAQIAGLAGRLAPGGRALQSGLNSVRGGPLRNAGTSLINNPAVKEAGDAATQAAANGTARAVICGVQ